MPRHRLYLRTRRRLRHRRQHLLRRRTRIPHQKLTGWSVPQIRQNHRQILSFLQRRVRTQRRRVRTQRWRAQRRFPRRIPLQRASRQLPRVRLRSRRTLRRQFPMRRATTRRPRPITSRLTRRMARFFTPGAGHLTRSRRTWLTSRRLASRLCRHLRRTRASVIIRACSSCRLTQMERRRKTAWTAAGGGSISRQTGQSATTSSARRMSSRRCAPRPTSTASRLSSMSSRTTRLRFCRTSPPTSSQRQAATTRIRTAMSVTTILTPRLIQRVSITRTHSRILSTGVIASSVRRK